MKLTTINIQKQRPRASLHDGQLLFGESEAELQGGSLRASEPDEVAVGAASEAEEVAVALVHGSVSAAESESENRPNLLV